MVDAFDGDVDELEDFAGVVVFDGGYLLEDGELAALCKEGGGAKEREEKESRILASFLKQHDKASTDYDETGNVEDDEEAATDKDRSIRQKMHEEAQEAIKNALTGERRTKTERRKTVDRRKSVDRRSQIK